MSKTTTAAKKTVAKPAAKAPAKKPAAPAKAAPAKKAAVKVEKVEAEAPKKVNKMATAIIVFERMQKAGSARKDIIAAFQSEVGLTKAGAATYYQNIKKMD